MTAWQANRFIDDPQLSAWPNAVWKEIESCCVSYYIIKTNFCTFFNKLIYELLILIYLYIHTVGGQLISWTQFCSILFLSLYKLLLLRVDVVIRQWKCEVGKNSSLSFKTHSQKQSEQNRFLLNFKLLLPVFLYFNYFICSFSFFFFSYTVAEIQFFFSWLI